MRRRYQQRSDEFEAQRRTLEGRASAATGDLKKLHQQEVGFLAPLPPFPPPPPPFARMQRVNV